MLLTSASVWILMGAFGHPSGAEKMMDRSPEIEQLVMEWFESASKGDPSIVDAHVSSDDRVRLIGSDPGEWFKGGPAVAAFLRGEVTNAGGAVSFQPGEIEAFSEGTVGWAITTVAISLPDGKHVSPRWTSVFHREDGVWKFVLTHASFGVPNDEVGWTYS
jgi:ketosteroid isomerase-like protein